MQIYDLQFTIYDWIYDLWFLLLLFLSVFNEATVIARISLVSCLIIFVLSGGINPLSSSNSNQ